MTTSPTPRWLHAYATTTGADPALTGTCAVPRHCRDCRRLVLAGYDAPLLAALAVVDPHPLTPQLEAAAVILAIPTWRLWGTPGRYELTPRHEPGIPISVRREPAGPDVVVLAAHRCGNPLLSRTPLGGHHTPAPRPTDPPY